MKIKDLAVKIKAGPVDGLAEGQFTAYASVFGNVDHDGDVVAKGAFTGTLGQWTKSGNVLPLLWGHNTQDPDYNIGHIVSAAEDDHGLLVTAQLDLEQAKALQTYRLLKGRRVNQMSFAYDVVNAPQKDAASGANLLSELMLHEVSVVPMGANAETEILAVKARATKAVALLSQQAATAPEDVTSALTRVLGYFTAIDLIADNAQDEISEILGIPDPDDDDMVEPDDVLKRREVRAREAYKAIGAVIVALDNKDNQAKASGKGPVNDATASDEPSRNPSARTLATHLSILALSN